MPNNEIEKAVAILRAGGLVAFPTETVYGLGADASNPEAVKKIFIAKGRPQDHPVIVHLPDSSHLERWAGEIPGAARELARRFWPGPLTLILRRAPRVPDAVTGGQDTVGLRVPAHPVAQALLQTFGGGIAAPSANRFGRLSPTTAEHVRAELGDRIDGILDGGSCTVGIESTILDVSSEHPVLLRPGKITAAEIEAILGTTLRKPEASGTRAPGMLASHYAPQTPLLVTRNLAECIRSLYRQNQRVAVLAYQSPPDGGLQMVWNAAPVKAADYARELYANLRKLDQSGCDVIVVEEPPLGEEWAAVRDRLSKAAAKKT
ncbi:MAG TPA: L-threonylcarbamoyladenylate synthase [Burkholderiales bacterium]|nr:L-threonylcarbamoyladenylate synthase [Burkholderiales bacterium]